jgi:hypothetical protein
LRGMIIMKKLKCDTKSDKYGHNFKMMKDKKY